MKQSPPLLTRRKNFEIGRIQISNPKYQIEVGGFEDLQEFGGVESTELHS
jgi:hypothetical protein